jgi:hypothetical protein
LVYSIDRDYFHSYPDEEFCQIHQLCELIIVRLIDITRINIEVLQVITPGLFSAEPGLFVSILILASAIYQVSVYNLLYICPLCGRKGSISGNLAANEALGQAELAIVVVF